jgi:hypothetical protein
MSREERATNTQAKKPASGKKPKSGKDLYLARLTQPEGGGSQPGVRVPGCRGGGDSDLDLSRAGAGEAALAIAEGQPGRQDDDKMQRKWIFLVGWCRG